MHLLQTEAFFFILLLQKQCFVMQIDSLAVLVSVVIVGVEIQCHIGQRGNNRRKNRISFSTEKKNLLKVCVHATASKGGGQTILFFLNY